MNCLIGVVVTTGKKCESTVESISENLDAPNPAPRQRFLGWEKLLLSRPKLDNKKAGFLSAYGYKPQGHRSSDYLSIVKTSKRAVLNRTGTRTRRSHVRDPSRVALMGLTWIQPGYWPRAACSLPACWDWFPWHSTRRGVHSFLERP